VWAGLRPLVRAASSGRTADLSRRHRVAIGSRGVVTVTGGKLTTYRQMAEDTVDAVVRLLGRGGRSRTRKLRLLGADAFTEPEPGTPEAHLADRYGSLASMIDRIAADDADLGAPLVQGLPYLLAEAVYAARHEMATTLTDVLTRRTRAHLLDRGATVTAAPAIADLLATELAWGPAERERQLDDYRQLAAKEQIDAMATA
jgi:glycerol-3-phosphate dehydrogenase